MEKDRADGVKTEDKDTNTDTIRPTRHAPERFMEHYLPITDYITELITDQFSDNDDDITD